MSRRPKAAVEPPGPRPFLKWAGGKDWLVDEIKRLLPKEWAAIDQVHGRYFEPFMGGAALFWALRPKRAVLSDATAELVNVYRVVRDDVEALIVALDGYAKSYVSTFTMPEKHYYWVRDSFAPSDLAPTERAARTIFLNKTGYHGLYRVNRNGGFNVPFGAYKNPAICDAANLRACSAALQGVALEHAQFDYILSGSARSAQPGDLVYLDPPYVPEPGKTSFAAYTAAGFGDEQQERVVCTFRELASRGVYVLASNSRTERVRELYRGFRQIEVARPGGNNSDTTKRGRVPELLILGWERA